MFLPSLPFSVKPLHIVLLVVALSLTLFGGWVGYSLERGEVAELQQKLQFLEQESIRANALIAESKAKLNAELSAASEKYDSQVKNLMASSQEKDRQWVIELAKKDSTISQLKQSSTDALKDLYSLRARLALSTSDSEKELLKKQIEDQQKKIDDLNVRASGLACMDVKIPEEFRTLLSSVGDK